MPLKDFIRWVAVLAVICLWNSAARATGEAIDIFQTHLYAGRTAEAADALQEHLQDVNDDDQARFALGAVQFIQAVEHLAQASYKHGLRESHEIFMLPFFRLPAAFNPKPKPLTYDQLRKILKRFVTDLALAEHTLSGVSAPEVKLPLNIGLIRLDMNADGEITEDETLWRIFQRIAPVRRVTAENSEKFVIGFDRGDVPWLRAYSHLLMSLAEFLLAHDWQVAFEHTFHALFPRAGLPYSVLNEPSATPRDKFPELFAHLDKADADLEACVLKRQEDPDWFCGNEYHEFKEANREVLSRIGRESQWKQYAEIADFVAFVHLNHWPVIEPKRMAAALAHLESMITLSRESWRVILAEQDDENEWIPNPSQTSLIPGMRVTQERVDGWLLFLDEFEALLQGRKLLPHWRLVKGINLRRVFLEPSTFDLILWIQGSAAVPYLEEGEQTTRETWRQITDLFRGDFFSYAIWFN